MKETIKHLGGWLKKYSSLLKILFLFSVLLFVINQMTGILQGMTWHELKEILLAQRKRTLLLMTLVGLVGVLPMMMYDWVTVEILEEQGKPHLPRKYLLLSAWTTNTINNLAGFGGVIGATLRARFYGAGIETKKVVGTVSKVAIFMLSGLSLLCLISLVDIFLIRGTNPYRSYWIWLLGGSLFAPSLAIFIKLNHDRLFKEFPVKRVLKLYLGSLGQWTGALVTFLTVGQLLGVSVSSYEVYPLFVVATFIGMISMVPGGMGTFDVLMIMGLGEVGIAKELAVAWLLYYRIFYYIVPFLTGLYAFIHQTGAKVNEFFDDLPKLVAQKVAHFILVGMVYFAGIMMILLSMVPNLSNISWLVQKLLPFSFNFLDQTLNMLIGFLLLGLARGVANRVKKAYLPTVFVLIFCIMNTISRTFSWKLLIFYALLIGCLYLARHEFYRSQLVFSWESILCDGILYGSLFILYSVVGYYSIDRINHGPTPAKFLLFPSEDVWLQGFLGILLAAATLVLLYDYLSNTERPGIYFDEQRVRKMLANYPGTDYSQLIFLKDKRNNFYQVNEQDKVMFTFEIKGSKVFVLGDPVGDVSYFEEATLAFITKVDRSGYQVIFYGVTDTYALVLHDIGFDFIKLGETGSLLLSEVELEEIDLLLPVEESLCASERELSFSWLQPPYSLEILEKLEEVSNDWLNNHPEQYFSQSRFARTYLNQAPLGVAYDQEGEMLGFISTRYIANHQTLSYDMIRYVEQAPDYIGLYLVDSLINSCQTHNIERLDIGLAPLSNVGEAPSAFLKERLFNIVYKYSKPAHGFKAIRLFKENIATNWEPRYLSYQKETNSFFLLIQLYLLVVRGHRLSPMDMVFFDKETTKEHKHI
ncbi:bifunctional lysylphosphatidylglycerol flippase/synthetase MprF [Vagococcus intermedius]|uniref:Phosphatidylglycerol lysyltransferase n=1 Tax=Vagococcus intermedius TaxID=2991418 RepID=A0AAF0I8B1_9ENTE|nr:bifunctional lysylphosphatidylglycerol flippase/synthetase MprF [Vagococcus intermedius]WEG73756.1 bifunctional lysylphosphatidylglycerol flippase/synthetase MprF [Vagococcus intermedius]WEG75841.1 bifunctional lysylphosphatidylglycerol flippase/synthetase MprF [Vagococcus intermedius]